MSVSVTSFIVVTKHLTEATYERKVSFWLMVSRSFQFIEAEEGGGQACDRGASHDGGPPSRDTAGSRGPILPPARTNL